MTRKQLPHVFTIAPGAAFLKTLADALCDGALIPSFRDNGDPLSLADVTIYVPTRRAARALRTIFAERNVSRSAILPTIRPLGEFEEDVGFFDEAGAASLELNPPINAEQRVLELAKLVNQWAKLLPQNIRDLFGTDPLVLPSTPADAVWLARNLSDLLDEVAREDGNWAALDTLVSDDLAGWWQLTLKFMAIISEHWPQYLQDNGLSDPVDYRNAIMHAETARLERDGSRGPVIAAGSTGSVPATAALLQVIANLPNGAVVLPGLDLEMSNDVWDVLIPDDKKQSVYAHPQFGLKKLLQRFQIMRDQVQPLGTISPELSHRNAVLSSALMPAETTYQWHTQKHLNPDVGFLNVSEIVAANEAQEALAIAVALRQAIENNAVPAALVTTDRGLARRVSAELERFGITADDSGGTPLEHCPPAALFRLMLDVVFQPTDPVKLLALFKHPLCCLGQTRATTRRNAEVLELVALRGGMVALDLPVVLQRLQSVGVTDDDAYQADYVKRVTASQIEQAIELAIALTTSLEPLMQFANSKQPVTVSQACTLCVATFEALGRDEAGSLSRLYAGDNGEALAQHLRALVATRSDFLFLPHEWPSIYNAIISGKAIKPRSGSDPRVHIWGALEARLQHVETIVLGGLNEKTWPAQPADDPLLSRGMKAGISVEPPERRIGLSAHDFQMLIGSKHVILSRADRIDGAPSVPSRWLQRLHAVLGKEVTTAMQTRAAHYLHWSRQLDLGLFSKSEKRPCPEPALHLRPTSFSVTEIARLRRDPYAVHAKRILGLAPLEPLLREPDALARGNLFHKIVEDFVRLRKTAPGTAQDLKAVGTQLFAEAALPEDIHATWWRRFELMVDAFIAFETLRADSIAASHIEIKSSKVKISDTGATLSGRADRIDILSGGSAEVIDYKTGAAPSAKQVLSLLEPQLALEAALLTKRGFFNGEKITPSNLLYVQFEADGTVKSKSVIHSVSNKDHETAEQLGERAWQRLIELVRYYAIKEHGYLSRQAPFKEAHSSEYDHLARVAEWSGGGDEINDDNGDGE